MTIIGPHHGPKLSLKACSVGEGEEGVFGNSSLSRRDRLCTGTGTGGTWTNYESYEDYD